MLEESVSSEDRRKQMEKDLAVIQKAEAARAKRDIEEKFDQNTTYRYLNQLAAFGPIYINDAPLACLTTSNSVAEIKCSRKVMGVQMTEIVRSLAQFFMKEFPLDVKQRHIP